MYKTIMSIVGVGILVTPLSASELTVPNIFEPATPAVADEVNQNFNAVRDSVNDNDARVTVNQSDILQLDDYIGSTSNDTIHIHPSQFVMSQPHCITQHRLPDVSFMARNPDFQGGSSSCTEVAAVRIPTNAQVIFMVCRAEDNDGNGRADHNFSLLNVRLGTTITGVMLSTSATNPARDQPGIVSYTGLASPDLYANNGFEKYILTHNLRSIDARNRFHGCSLRYSFDYILD